MNVHSQAVFLALHEIIVYISYQGLVNFIARVIPLLEVAWEAVCIEFAHHELHLLFSFLLLQVIWEELLDIFNQHSSGSWEVHGLFGFFISFLIV